MAAVLSHPARKGTKKLEGKCLKLDGTLHGRVTSKTKSLFDPLGASPDLTRSVREWDLDPAYRHARERTAALSAVNDAAERGIALIEKFNNSITRDGQQKQHPCSNWSTAIVRWWAARRRLTLPRRCSEFLLGLGK